MAKEKRTKSIKVRFTETEYETLKDKAKNRKSVLAVYCRDKLLSNFRGIIKKDKNNINYLILKDLNYMRASLNQIAKSINSHLSHLSDDEKLEILLNIDENMNNILQRLVEKED